MGDSLPRNRYVTHTILNLLSAGYYGVHILYEGLHRLSHSDYREESFRRSEEIIEKAVSLSRALWKDELLFDADWNVPETDEAVWAVNLLYDLKDELYRSANEVIRCIAQHDLMGRKGDISSLAAALRGSIYARASYIRNALEFGLRFGFTDEVERCSPLLAGAQDEIAIVEGVLDHIVRGRGMSFDFFRALIERCWPLSGAFRTYAHEINKVTAPYRGGMSFEAADFPEEQAMEWHGAGFDPGEAGYWRAYSFSPSEASEWKKTNLAPQEAAAWRYHHFTPESMQPRRRRGLDESAGRSLQPG